MQRWIVYWDGQDLTKVPAWPVCAGHRETVRAPLLAPEVVKHYAGSHKLVVDEVGEGICALAAFGNCCDDPVKEIPVLDIKLLDRDE